MAEAAKSKKQTTGTSNASFEAQLWAAADALRNNMDAADYKHVVLGLILLKYISDAFEAKHKELEAQKRQGADPEDPDEYRGSSICWVTRSHEGCGWRQRIPSRSPGDTAEHVDEYEYDVHFLNSRSSS